MTITANSDKSLSTLLSAYVMAVDLKTFLDTADPISKSTNWDRIKRKYSLAELQDNESKYPTGDILVKSGTQLDIRVSYIKRDVIGVTQSDLFNITSFKPFIAEQLAELLRDPKYTKAVNSYSGEQIANITNNDVTVYIWCRALSKPNSLSQEGAWLNVSAFVENLSTEKSDVGSFSIDLSSLSCEWSDSYGWEMSSSVVGFDVGAVRDDALSVSTLQQYDPKDPGFYYREKFLFNTVLQANDLVYIRFEKLELDQELDSKLREVNGQLSGLDIPNRIYDMIGLVDNVSISTNPKSVNINVSGRDMMKLLIEDGSYFFPEQFAQNIFTDENSILTKRNRIELEAHSLAGASYTFKSIQTILKFIFNKYSNIGIVPNSIFNGYGSRAIKSKYQLKSSEFQALNGSVINKLNDRFLKEERQGVWKICEFIFDPQIANRVLADNSISQDNGSILNSIRKVCQEPFIEFYGDTYKDKFYFFVRKQPFDEKGYKGLLYNDFVSEDNVISSNTGIEGDDKQKNAIKKKLELERQLSFTGAKGYLSDLVIDIDDVDVLGEPQLSYHDEVYSWYRVIPRGLGVIDEATAFQLAPIVPFDAYAEVWGNKALSIEYNYAPTEYLQDSGFKARSDYAESQAFYDLQFIIQSHQYLPFTRRGTITLVGNRTIKRGLFIYFKPTREVFYVDSVVHTRSAQGNSRSTVLRVSRGMREDFVKGKFIKFPSGEKLVSYFKIINTDIANSASINSKDFLKNWKVDRDIFNFFIQRRQWVD